MQLKIKKDIVMKIRVPSKARDKLKIKAKKELTTMTEIIRRAILRECRRK